MGPRRPRPGAAASLGAAGLPEGFAPGRRPAPACSPPRAGTGCQPDAARQPDPGRAGAAPGSSRRRRAMAPRGGQARSSGQGRAGAAAKAGYPPVGSKDSGKPGGRRPARHEPPPVRPHGWRPRTVAGRNAQSAVRAVGREAQLPSSTRAPTADGVLLPASCDGRAGRSAGGRDRGPVSRAAAAGRPVLPGGGRPLVPDACDVRQLPAQARRPGRPWWLGRKQGLAAGTSGGELAAAGTSGGEAAAAGATGRAGDAAARAG